MEAVAVKKQAKLREQAGELQKRLSLTSEGSKNLGELLEQHRRERASLENQRLSACKLEAQGKSSDRAKIENALSAVNGRITGLEALIADKQSEITSLSSERDSIHTELRELDRQETMEREIAAINQSFADGQSEVVQHEKVVGEFNRRIAGLRGGQYSDERVKHAAFEAAHKLERMWAGMRP
jgi:chromosome segregation ATPase